MSNTNWRLLLHNLVNALPEHTGTLDAQDAMDDARAALAEPEQTVLREPAPTETLTGENWWRLHVLREVAKKNPDALRLAAQLVGLAPCPVCDFVAVHCRCVPPQPAPTETPDNDLPPEVLAVLRDTRPDAPALPGELALLRQAVPRLLERARRAEAALALTKIDASKFAYPDNVPSTTTSIASTETPEDASISRRGPG